MKKIFLTNVVLLSLITNIYAETRCDEEARDRGNHRSMLDCSSTSLHSADKTLNITYKKLVRKHKNNKKFINNLKLSQRAWIKFRDAEIEMRLTYANAPGNYGQMNALFEYEEMEALTRDRTEVLKKYIKHGFIDDYSEL